VRFSSCLLLVALLVFLCVPTLGRAGVTIESRMDVTMLGGGGKGSGKVEIEGRARRETRTITLGVAGSDMGQEQRSDAITRLDRDVQWQLDADDSTFRTVALERLGDTAGAGGMAMPGLTPEAASTLTWKVEVTPRDETTIVAGYRARRTDITLTGTAHPADEGNALTIRLVTQWWMSSAVPGAAQMHAFDEGFEHATGGLGADVPGLLAGLPGAAEGIRQLTAARRDLAGVPLRTVIAVEAPGLGSMLGRALSGQGDEGAAPDAGADTSPLVTSTIEVTAIHAGRIAPSRFALPAGYRAAAAAKDDAPPPEVHE
jgi:hypothetical protein